MHTQLYLIVFVYFITRNVFFWQLTNLFSQEKTLYLNSCILCRFFLFSCIFLT